MEKLKIGDEQKDNILSVIASLINRIDALEDESEKNIKFEKEKLRTQILSSISHDLKTPLAAIIGALNLITSMSTRISEEQKQELIESSISEAHRLNNFITNILNMARIESGVVKPKMEWQNVEDIVKHIQKKFRLKYPDRILKINEIPGYISVNMDSALFEQMMFNMLDNSVKYSPPGSEIELDIEKNSSLDFIIIDHGNAVPEDMLEKIFDKYARLQIEDRKIAGTGLGLAIAKSLADLQNATITAAKHPEGGMMMITSCPEWKI
jgi:two-component system sensor histidine kinase KdpD